MAKILIADDDFLTRKMLCKYLQSFGEIDQAATGLEALAAYDLSVLTHEPYDLMLMDIAMPAKSGIEALEKIREQEEEKKVPEDKRVKIVMITGDKRQMMRSFERGCDDYLLKPVDPKKLAKKITDIIAGKTE